MDQFAEEQRRKWEANVQKMNDQKQKEAMEKWRVAEEKKKQKVMQQVEEHKQKERLKQEQIQQKKEEKEAREIEKRQNQLMKKLKEQAIALEKQKLALKQLEQQIACGKVSHQSSIQTAQFNQSQTEDESNETVEVVEDDLLNRTQQSEQPEVANEQLNQTQMTVLTEVANVQPQMGAEYDQEKDSSIDGSFRAARYQNFISDEAALSDVHLMMQQEQDQHSVKQSAHKYSVVGSEQSSQQSKYSRKDQVILELELKANVQQMRKKLKSKEEQDLEERQKLQQEFLKHLLHPKQTADTADKVNHDFLVATSSSFDRSSFGANDSRAQSAIISNRKVAQHQTPSLYQQSLAQQSQFTATLNDREPDLDQVTVRSVIQDIRRSTANVAQSVSDNLTESGLFDRDSQYDAYQDMLQMSMNKFQQHLVTMQANDLVDFELSADEIKLAEMRAVKQAQAEIEMSQSLITDLMSYSQSASAITQSYQASMVPTIAGATKFKFNQVEQEGNLGEARQFFYGADEAGISLASKDFESAYRMDGYSQMSVSMRLEERTPSKVDQNSTSVIFSEHQLISSQDSSMVNLAVTMDHFTQQQQARMFKNEIIDRQKLHLAKIQIEELPRQEQKQKLLEQDQISVEKYSEDEFESDDDEKLVNKTKSDFNPSLSLNDKSQAQIDTVTLGGGEDSDKLLRDTSRFGVTTNTDKTFDPLSDLLYNPKKNLNEELESENELLKDYQPRQRSLWNRDSFGIPIDNQASFKEESFDNQDNLKDEFEEIKQEFTQSQPSIPVKRKVPEAVLLDFNDELGDTKKRKFEDFKARQQLRQQLRKRDSSVEQQKPTAKYGIAKDQKSTHQSSQQNEKLIIRPKAAVTVIMDEHSNVENLIKISPQILKARPRIVPEGKPQLPQGIGQDIQLQQLAQQRGPLRMSPSRSSPASLGTPSIIPKKAYQKQTNCQLIRLALTQISLAGQPNKIEREQVLNVIAQDNNQNYIILFKGQIGRYDYSALYALSDTGDQCVLVHGNQLAPAILTSEMIESYFRYNSGAKDFVQIGAQQITMTTDAVTLKKEFKQQKQKIQV